MSETEFLQHNSINRIGHSPSKKDKIPPIMLDVSLNGKTIPMELDTGGGFSIVSLDLMQKFFPNVKIHRVQEPLISYSKTKFNKIGEAYFSVTFGKRTLQLPLGIVDIPGESIFGRDWIFWYRDLLSISELFEPDQIFTSNSNTIHNVQPDSSLSKILDKFPNFFHENAGLMKGPPVDFHFKSDCEPVFAKARLLPYTLLDLYSQEIDRKLKLGFYEQVQASEWASPTHVVYKNGKLRITGDYKATLNPCLIADEYPIPKIQEILHKLRGAKYFCKLDITDAFMSLPCTQKASEAMTLNTPTHGLIRPTRAQYGVCSIPAIWQRRLQAALSHLKNAINFFDDVLVFADSIEDLLIALEETLQAIADAGLKLNRPKSKFFLTSVDFVGYQIDATGLHKLNKHILPIINAPKPNTAAQLRTFLGKVTYYHSFIEHLSSKTSPLRKMLISNKFSWTKEGEEAYELLKAELVSDKVLTPYNPSLPLILAVDTSPVGLGAVLSHIMPNNLEKPIAYASKALNKTELAYTQSDREALATVWGVKKFFQYV